MFDAGFQSRGTVCLVNHNPSQSRLGQPQPSLPLGYCVTRLGPRCTVLQHRWALLALLPRIGEDRYQCLFGVETKHLHLCLGWCCTAFTLFHSTPVSPAAVQAFKEFDYRTLSMHLQHNRTAVHSSPICVRPLSTVFNVYYSDSHLWMLD